MIAKPCMTISVVRLLGVDAILPRVLRIRGIASPRIGTAGGSKSPGSGIETGSTVGMATGGGPALAGGIVALAAVVVSISRSDMATGAGVGVPTGVGTGVARGF